jgi:hypothetical protein
MERPLSILCPFNESLCFFCRCCCDVIYVEVTKVIENKFLINVSGDRICPFTAEDLNAYVKYFRLLRGYLTLVSILSNRVT